MINFKTIKSEVFPKSFLETRNRFDAFSLLKDAPISTAYFCFYTSVSSFFPSKIEEEDIDLDSYIKHKSLGIAFQPDYTKKIDDFYNAYTFAKENELNEVNLLEAHKVLTENFVQPNFQGIYKKTNRCVLTDQGQIEYVATSLFEVENEMNKFFLESNTLLSEKLEMQEVFFYTSFGFHKNSSNE